MPQSILVQVGQCGNQCGFQFWHKAVEEYQVYKRNLCEEAVFHFFRPVKTDPLCDMNNFTEYFNARAVLIDMEHSVINEGCRGPLKELFGKKQILTDVSGSGNNWAVGNLVYGSKYNDSMMNLFRKEAECCDSLQCFLLTFSMGGGTGSGLGTAALESLYYEYPKTPRLVFAVFPSATDDVIISPYNSVLANSKLIEYASSVIPFENKALNDMCLKMEKLELRTLRPNSGIKLKTEFIRDDQSISDLCHKPFDSMNNIIARTMLDITSSTRFPGKLNMDLNDIIVNMMPFPKLHYIVSSIAPLLNSTNDSKIDRLFSDLSSEGHNLFQCSGKRGKILSSAVLGRGQVTSSDIHRNLDRMNSSLKFVPWSNNGWKIGLCDVAPLHCSKSLLLLVNTTEIAHKFGVMREKFFKMYEKKAHLHHFIDIDANIDVLFRKATDDLTDLITRYQSIELINEFGDQPRPCIL